MSNYSTDELVELVQREHQLPDDEERNAIISRLRKADEIVKEARSVGGWLRILGDHELDALRKLLDEYEKEAK